jgi:hypothetical protein
MSANPERPKSKSGKLLPWIIGANVALLALAFAAYGLLAYRSREVFVWSIEHESFLALRAVLFVDSDVVYVMKGDKSGRFLIHDIIENKSVPNEFKFRIMNTFRENAFNTKKMYSLDMNAKDFMELNKIMGEQLAFAKRNP